MLAASDAVGMGLNLQIRRIIFLSLNKFDGVSDRRLTAAETKQIAGRAGRCGRAGESMVCHWQGVTGRLWSM